ncbi:hypothetical protein BDQ17DRAFT_1423212 [Cyathus striatus]|nr:hypothetical protein BDQ17DRAFT_1423212 [Cyathus striatus]
MQVNQFYGLSEWIEWPSCGSEVQQVGQYADHCSISLDEETKGAMCLNQIEVSAHLTSLVYGIWPELLMAWRLATLRSHLPGISHSLASTQFAGVSYISALHLDEIDLTHTIGLTIKKNLDVLQDGGCSSSFYNAAYRVQQDAKAIANKLFRAEIAVGKVLNKIEEKGFKVVPLAACVSSIQAVVSIKDNIHTCAIPGHLPICCSILLMNHPSSFTHLLSSQSQQQEFHLMLLMAGHGKAKTQQYRARKPEHATALPSEASDVQTDTSGKRKRNLSVTDEARQDAQELEQLDSTGLHRSARSSCGQGGQLERMHQFEEATLKPPVRKHAAGGSIPEDIPENPMAPPIRGHPASTTASTAKLNTKNHPLPSHLNKAPVPISHVAEAGSRFGFRLPSGSTEVDMPEAAHGTAEARAANNISTAPPSTVDSEQHHYSANGNHTSANEVFLPAPPSPPACTEPIALDADLEVYQSKVNHIDAQNWHNNVNETSYNEGSNENITEYQLNKTDLNISTGFMECLVPFDNFDIMTDIPPDIDEFSPDEDENDSDEHEGVLNNNKVDNNEDNRPYAPLNPHNLLSCSESATTEAQPAATDYEGDNDDGDSNKDESNSESAQSRHAQETPRRLEAMQSQPPWDFRCYVVLTNPFPESAYHMHIATEILSQIISGFKGKLNHADWEHNRDMDMVNMGRKMVTEHYSSALSPEMEYGNQQAEYDMVMRNVRNLLDGGAFMHSGRDNQNKVDNLGHKCIKKFCIEFFYGTKVGKESPLAEYFKEDFSESIPEYAMALVITCITNCLEDAIIKCVIKDIKSDPYHGPILRAKLREWAQIGNQKLESTSVASNKYNF